jgi:predicted RNase H-like nuclease (RuvC/YqgF family)
MDIEQNKRMTALKEENERLLAANKNLQDRLEEWREDAAQLREVLKEIADAKISGVVGDGYNVRDWLIKHHVMLVNKARAVIEGG